MSSINTTCPNCKQKGDYRIVRVFDIDDNPVIVAYCPKCRFEWTVLKIADTKQKGPSNGR